MVLNPTEECAMSIKPTATQSLALSTAIALALATSASAAPVPNALRFSVYVTNQSGQPFTGSIDLQLEFFDAASGGTNVAGPLVIEDVPVQGGVGFFVGDFGSTNPMGNRDTYIGGGLRLGSSTGAFTQFTGRGRFHPTGFALHAQKIAPGIVGSAEILPNQVQTRVAGSCVVGQAIRQVNVDGSVDCQVAGSGSGGGGGGTITAVVAGNGLSGGGNSGSVTLNIAAAGVGNSEIASGAVDASKLAANSVGSTAIVDGAVGGVDIDASQIQRRVSGACTAGQAIRSVNPDGTVVCESSSGGGSGWGLNGNAVGSGEFLGTTNALPLELRTNSAPAMRLSSLNDPNGGAYGGGISTISTALGDTSFSVNQATGPGSSVLGGGNAAETNHRNIAAGAYATTVGGLGNQAGGDYSLAAGRKAVVRDAAASGDADGDQGSMLFADAQDLSMISSGPNQFAVRAAGGVFFGANSTSVSMPAGRFINTSTGAFLSSGGTWTNASSAALKFDFIAADPDAILQKVRELPLSAWRYLASPDEGYHLGPIAEDFYSAFGLGHDSAAISTVDASGVALAAIQALDQENTRLRAELAELRSMINRIEARTPKQ
jgi:hypothetical protein